MATNTFTERIKIQMQGAKKAASDGKKVESSLKKIQKAAVMAGGSFFAAQGLINGFKHIVNLSLETEKVAQGGLPSNKSSSPFFNPVSFKISSGFILRISCELTGVPL